MPVKPAPTTTAVSRPGPSGAVPRPLEVGLERHGVLEGVRARPVLGEPGHVGAMELAARREQEPVVRERAGGAAGARHQDRAPVGIDARGRGVHEIHPDGPEHARERHPHVLAGMGFVQARPDGQVPVTGDEAQPDVGGTARVVELPHRRHGPPEPGESPSDDDDVLHRSRCPPLQAGPSQDRRDSPPPT